MSMAEKCRAVKYDDGSLFCGLTKKCGLILYDGGRPSNLRVEQGKFAKDLNDLLLGHPRYPEVVQDILEDIRQYLDSTERFMQALAPIERLPSSASNVQQDSTVRLLLRVDPLQQQLCQLLLEKIVQTTIANEECDSTHIHVLNQLRLLDGLVTTHEFTEQMFEALAAVPASVRRDMIVALPDILHDSCHSVAAVKLSALLSESTEESPAILEALGNFYMDTGLITEIRTQVLSSLKSADIAHIPTLVKYVLSNITSEDKIVSMLRDNLDFCPVQSSTKSRMDEDYQLLTLNEIKNSIRFDKFIGEAWCRAIESIRSPSEHKPLDILFLVVWYSVCQRPKAVELLVRSKARQGHFTPSLLAATFNNHSQVLRAYAGTVLQLAQALLWCAEPFGSHLYKHAFLCFEGSMRQEVIVNLVTHVGSGVPSQMDAALSVLQLLVQENTRTVAPFGAFFKSMLDFVRNLSLRQFRTLFSLLATVAYRGGSEGAMFRDELHMYIRKMLTSFCPRSQRVGIVGALMTVQAMAMLDRKDDELGAGSSSTTQAPALQEAIELLELCRSSTLAVPHALGLFYDELSRIVVLKQLHHRIRAWIGDIMIADFQDNYVVDVDDAHVSARLRFGLDNLPNGAIALNLGPLVEAEHTGTTSALTLCPLFRLLRVTEQVLHGDSLETVDALLGCPVLFPPSDGAITLTCTATFYCINWFRELVNGFCGLVDSSIQEKVIDRIKRIVELQECLEKWLPGISSYVPPLAVLDVDSVRPVTAVVARRGKSAKGGKKRKRTNEEDHSNCSEEKSDELEENSHPTEGKFYWRPYFRELDLEVFDILRVGVQYKESGTGGFTPKEMLFLLDDLNAKLDLSLSRGRRLPFKDKVDVEPGFSNLTSRSPCDIIKFVLRILPHLLSILEETSAYFQLRTAEQDGMQDTPVACDNNDASLCMARLLTILHCFLSWNGFDSLDNRDLLREMLHIVSSRVGTTQLTQVHIHQLGRRSFSYLSAFADSVCDLESAAALVRLLSCLAHRAEMEPSVQDIARRFLCQEWPPRSSAAPLQTLLSTFLSDSPSLLKALGDIADEESSDLHAFLSRCSPSIYCKTLFVQLVECAKSLSFDTSNENNQLEMWGLAVGIFHKLLTTVKKDAVRANLSAALRFGRFFLDHFLRGGMPVLDSLFKDHPVEVQALLKNLQQGTRFLQHACGHSKVTKDVGLTGQVPFVKKALESLVFRVKAMLRKHGCQDAFWLGNLKNRDLQGEEILSQATVSEDAGELSDANSAEDDLEASEDY